tara:strand:- start:216 stop:653 length:438 start_codon:yes stop_codon:yes gene_type:complete
MKQSTQKIELNYKAADLYKIVLDIDEYPNYIPWCTDIKIISKNKKQIIANMIVDYKIFPTQKFTSKVDFDFKKLIIKTQYIEGPLKNLNTIWQFKDFKKNKSKIIFIVEFEFKNLFHQKLAELFYPLIEKKMVNSFIKRAEEILN